jgi:hypothetical protein
MLGSEERYELFHLLRLRGRPQLMAEAATEKEAPSLRMQMTAEEE